MQATGGRRSGGETRWMLPYSTRRTTPRPDPREAPRPRGRPLAAGAVWIECRGADAWRAREVSRVSRCRDSPLSLAARKSSADVSAIDGDIRGHCHARLSGRVCQDGHEKSYLDPRGRATELGWPSSRCCAYQTGMPLKRRTRREEPGVIESSERTHDPLVAAANDEADALIHLEAAEDDTRGERGLRLTIVRATMKIGIGGLNFRPKPAEVPLKGGVPGDRTA